MRRKKGGWDGGSLVHTGGFGYGLRVEGVEVEDRGLRVEVQQMLDTWDIETQRRRTGARALVTVFSDARTLLESVIEDELVGNRILGIAIRLLTRG